MQFFENYDVVVIGAGHAGCEAALSCARLGHSTLLATLNLDALAMMACNPAIGGTAKGHLVRELDALGGEMGRAIDDVFIQSRMLNTGKGPAVHSLRAQADKKAYQLRMRKAVDECENLDLRQAEARRITEIPRRKEYIPVRVTASMHDLVERAAGQNFVPVVDDKDTFIGLITRKAIIQYCAQALFSNNDAT